MHSKSDIVLSARGLSKFYDKKEALHDVSFELKAGEIMGLLGPNGAGKTTAIRILSTILPANRGQFTVMGIPDSRPEGIRAQIGVVPESNGFPSYMTGEAYLTYMGRLYGASGKTAREKAAELLNTFGLKRVGGSAISTYSRGMRQRLGIARALVHSPRVLFLDEPTLGLDPRGQREMLQVVKDAAKTDRVAVVLSSHLLEVVEGICTRVLILNRGHLVAEGTVAEIKRQVSVARTCRIQAPLERIQEAQQALAAMNGVAVDQASDRKDELIISVQGQTNADDMNEVLQRLIQAGVPIEAFTKDSMRLSDAFLSMVEEIQV